jgi:hypothetical protein
MYTYSPAGQRQTSIRQSIQGRLKTRSSEIGSGNQQLLVKKKTNKHKRQKRLLLCIFCSSGSRQVAKKKLKRNGQPSEKMLKMRNG